MTDFACTLTLHDDHKVTYEDNTHRPIEGPVSADDLQWAAVRWLRRWVEADQQEDGRAEGLQLLGRCLYELVFRGEIRENFEDTFSFFDRPGGGEAGTLRLELRFHPEAKELSRLPWEFLYLKLPTEQKGRFLAGEHNAQLVLSRFVPKRKQEGQALPRPRPTVLMAISQPPDRQFSVDALRRFLQEQHDNNRIRLILLDDPTADDLKRAMSADDPAERPDIFYFVGHGTGDYLSVRRSPAEARQHDRASGVSPLSPRPSGESFGELRASGLQDLFLVHQPKLVFLQACKGDSEGREALYSLAKAVVYVRVPAVIAMQYEIDSGPANTFAQAVFGSLIEGRTIGQAVTAGRKALAGPYRGQSWDRRDFGTPVVYVHDDVALVEAPAETPLKRRATTAAATEATTRTCPQCLGPVSGRACGVCVLLLLCPSCDEKLDQPGSQKICGACFKPLPTLRASGFETGEPPARLRAVGGEPSQ
jgi:CHAT domain